MPLLLLDIDLTVFATSDDLQYVHPSHKLSFSQKAQLIDKELHVWFINPEELKALIECAYNDFDGIILFTSGTWHESVRTVIADSLALSESTSQQVKECLFLSPLSCQDNFPEKSIDEIMYLSKNIRFERYLAKNTHLREKYFVFLDDDADHISSFAQSNKVRPIWAKTSYPGMQFYEEAQDILKLAQIYELLGVSSWLKTCLSPDENTANSSAITFGPYNDDLLLQTLEQVLSIKKTTEKVAGNNHENDEIDKAKTSSQTSISTSRYSLTPPTFLPSITEEDSDHADEINMAQRLSAI